MGFTPLEHHRLLLGEEEDSVDGIEKLPAGHKASVLMGFTLIESIIYMAVVSILLISAGAIITNILFGKAKYTAEEEVGQNARFIMEKITAEIRNAMAINQPDPGLAGGELSLDVSSVAENPIIFQLTGGKVQIKRGGGGGIDLSSDEVEITNLQFLNVSLASESGAVRIQMTIKYKNPQNRQEYNFEESFYTTKNINK